MTQIFQLLGVDLSTVNFTPKEESEEQELSVTPPVAKSLIPGVWPEDDWDLKDDETWRTT